MQDKTAAAVAPMVEMLLAFLLARQPARSPHRRPATSRSPQPARQDHTERWARWAQVAAYRMDGHALREIGELMGITAAAVRSQELRWRERERRATVLFTHLVTHAG